MQHALATRSAQGANVEHAPVCLACKIAKMTAEKERRSERREGWRWWLRVGHAHVTRGGSWADPAIAPPVWVLEGSRKERRS